MGGVIELSLLLGVLGVCAGWGAAAYAAGARRRRALRTLPPPGWPPGITGSSWLPRAAPHQAGPLRASHADRERTAALLRQAMADGYLSVEELEERLGGTFAAKHLEELDRLLADLPGAPRPSAPPPSPPPVLVAAPPAPVPARRRAVPLGAMLLVAWIAMGAASHTFILPGWPLLLVGLLLVRRARRSRRH